MRMIRPRGEVLPDNGGPHIGFRPVFVATVAVVSQDELRCWLLKERLQAFSPFKALRRCYSRDCELAMRRVGNADRAGPNY